MKFNLLTKAMLCGAAVAMVSCSNDEPVKGDQQKPLDGDVAYMTVTISSADKSSRATTDGGYEDGSLTPEDEINVKNVRFFFFDDKGAAMDLTAYMVDPNANLNLAPGEKPNIEHKLGKNILVLEDMTSNQYPSYMITIINNDKFECGTNLTNTLELLSDYKTNNGFVMSTSSYAPGAGETRPYYHVTNIEPGNFKQTPEAAVADNAPVEIYVERLASKVTLKLADEIKSGETTLDDGTKIYKLEQTVANGTEGDNVDGDNTNLNTDLYIKVLGWNVNTTANNSYMMKNIDTKWDFIWQRESWNKPEYFRSFWAKSYTYGDNAAAIASKVTYVPTKEIDVPNGLRAAAYCNENTNTVNNVFAEENVEDNARALVDSRVVTNVVLHTQIVEKDGGKVNDLVMANGTLFRGAAYLQYILNRAYAGTDGINLWIQTEVNNGTTTNDKGETVTTTTTKYAQIGKEFFSLAYPENYEGLGDVDVVFNEDAFNATTATTKYYVYKEVETEDGKTENKYVEATAEEIAAAVASIKTQIAAVQPEGVNHAVIYEGGHNIYFIPIEHLAADHNQKNAVEGYYGVVRNHIYNLTINSFSKVGHGIWDPKGDKEETAKPEKPEDPLYYLGAHINILSWKVVNQDVDL
ncbi:MAG: fimbria major subunit [Clostridiales bacterium]|nr:fimbria major subunit [Clostridiales bacterium]